jgi:predicted house-cleaning noncanonical NTP pyrophosphatase (MazG superfamily)
MNADEVWSFLVTEARKFVDGGLRAQDFCFLFHHFIPANAGSWSLAVPGVHRVRVDSIWGVPDGLLYLPHDSFEVDTRTDTVTWQKLRCKSEYIDFGTKGEWFEKTAGSGWDWKPSATAEALVTIAHQARSIADHVKAPVEVMHFIGVRPKSDMPSCLPWYFREASGMTVEDGASASRLRGQARVLRTMADLSAAREEAQKGRREPLRLRPLPELVHSQEFVGAVADISVANQIVVELEGSVLSHAYYMLRKAGVRVSIVDPGAPEHVREVRQFGKLVRDSVPRMIESGGEGAVVARATEDELLRLLLTKAVEESLELHAAHDEAQMFEEAADVLEVLRAICDVVGEDLDSLIERADAKRQERGGFEQGLVLRRTYIKRLETTKAGDPQFEVSTAPSARSSEFVGHGVSEALDALGASASYTVPLVPPIYPVEANFDLQRIDLSAQLSVRRSDYAVVIRVGPPTRIPAENAHQLSLFPAEPDPGDA